MNMLEGIGGISKLNSIRADLELQKSNFQRIENTLENLKGIKGEKGITKAAKGFESMFIYQMLGEMRKTVPKSTLFGDSFAMDVFMSMLDEKIADRIADTRTFGLSNMLIQYLEKKYNINKGEETDSTAGSSSNEKALLRDSRTKKYSLTDRINHFVSIINEAAAKYKIDPDLLKAVIAQESSGKPDAVSKHGAKGLMQLMDTTAEQLGVQNVFDPKENILAGARYLKELLEKHRGDLKTALAAYNAGPGTVKLYNGIPPYSETHNYIQRVISLQNHFRRGEQI